jgi:hypothetical protein
LVAAPVVLAVMLQVVVEVVAVLVLGFCVIRFLLHLEQLLRVRLGLRGLAVLLERLVMLV